MLRILPLIKLSAFEKPKPVAVTMSPPSRDAPVDRGALDTIVVPAQRDGFERVFVREQAWYAIRIGGAMLDKIKYCAAYQTSPISAVTHFAPVKQIEPYGESGKYRLIFAVPAKPIGPIALGDATPGIMQGPRYTSFSKLSSAKQVTDLF